MPPALPVKPETLVQLVFKAQQAALEQLDRLVLAEKLEVMELLVRMVPTEPREAQVRLELPDNRDLRETPEILAQMEIPAMMVPLVQQEALERPASWVQQARPETLDH